MWTFLVHLLIVLLSPVLCYHDPTNENIPYHCWWNNASVSNPDPIDCRGIEITWIQKPPSHVGLNEIFNVSYRLVVKQDSFFSSMVAFDFDEYRNVNISNPEALRYFCTNSACQEELSSTDDFRFDCCVWHANVHVCHPREVCGTRSTFCGPWIDNDQEQSTHTIATYGRLHDVFQAEMGIRVLGTNYVIAHIRIGDIQLAIQEIVTVNHQCGDNKCDNDETCSNCPSDCCMLPSYAIIIIVLILFLTLLLLPIVFLVCFCYRRRKLFYDESWIIDIKKLKRTDQVSHLRDGISSVISLHTMLLPNKSPESESCNGNRLNTGNPASRTCSSLASEPRQAAKHHFFTQTGIYEGRAVAIKKIPKRQILLTNQIRTEVMKVRALDHPNLCRFVGATVINPSVVSEYCPKGSLNDVLQNEDVPLNWGFRLSFATDIARGMAYLHNKKMYHERLCSNNCVIDDRWTVKISDYGLPSFRVPSDSLLAQRGNTVLHYTMYQAPERRKAGLVLPTPTADVYSFSIILFEISTRINLNYTELFVDNEGRPKPPDLKSGDCPCSSQYMELMKQCWDLCPNNRPSFDQVKKSLHKMNPHKESPVDMMMIMMEKYSNHLEQLVVDRTQELIVEQRKTSNLLYSMLPRQVADELRHGRPTAAQSFRSSTIFFSDIVGFTTLAGGSTPMEVVNMLNGLYSLFDDVLDTLDVYKVETIGDAYMVVSGVPQENGNRHAGEIAKMALKFLEVSETFKIPHRPSERLKIRIGIHSGPVCAGVVGLKMPRYCLFGDTVNTASRMESTSEAMRIQCSNETYNILKTSDIFSFECRGNIEVKGKGQMTTWWLTGQKQTMDTPFNSTSQLLLRLGPARQQLSPSSLSSGDVLSPHGSLGGMKHPFSCSPLSTPVRRSRDLLPISVTDYSSGQTVLNLHGLSDMDT